MSSKAIIPSPMIDLDRSTLAARAVSATEIDLSWQVARGTATGFQVERNDRYGNAGWQVIGTTSDTTYHDVGLTPGTLYYYKVCATGINGNSGYVTISAKTWPAAPTVPTRMSAPQAIQAAQSFCHAMGQPVTADATAEYHVLDDTRMNLMNYWQPRWQIVFDRQAKVEVVDATGDVSSYENLAWWSGPESASLHPAGAAISQSTAIQQATMALLATGQAEQPSSSLTATEEQQPNLNSFATHYWDIEWPRRFQGITYPEDGVSVLMQAETGQIEMLSFTYKSPPLTDATISVSQAQALAAAQAQLTSARMQVAAMDAPQIEIVQANSYWQDGNTRPEPGSAPHLAYSFRFHFDDATLSGPSVEVLVDAQSGSIIGGSSSGRVA